MPSPLSSGYIHLTFSSHPNLHAHSPLSLFRPSHFNLGIIGIAACSSSVPLSTASEQFENTLAEISPETSTFPLAKICFAFQDDEGLNVGLGENPSGLATIPNAMGNKRLYIGTLLADLCSQILAEFGHLVRDLELIPVLRLKLSGPYIGNTVGQRILECHTLPDPPCHFRNATSVPGLFSQSVRPHHVTSDHPDK